MEKFRDIFFSWYFSSVQAEIKKFHDNFKNKLEINVSEIFKK
jgi:hypothetical protein